MDLKKSARRMIEVVTVMGSALALGGCVPGPVTPPAGERLNTFQLVDNSSTSPNSFSLVSGSLLNFYGQVSISGENSEAVAYSEGPNEARCTPPSGTVVEALALSVPTAFTFEPNGSYGPQTGLMDLQFKYSGTQTLNGAIYTSSCLIFSPAQAIYSLGNGEYEFPGGGNTSVPSGSYYLEAWD